MKLSIIIPHHNIASLLTRCINSIPINSNHEIIIIDDNSDSQLVNFDAFPGKDRPDTTVIFTKEGKGAGYARNIGLKHAQGDWVIFADADDFFLPGAFDRIESYFQSDYDAVYFNAECRYSDHLDQVSNRMDYYINGINENKVNELRYYLYTPEMKLIRHDIIRKNSICFEEKPVANDAYFSTLLGYYAKNLKIDQRPLMCITARKGSLMLHEHTKEERIIRIETVFKCNRFLNKIGKNKYTSDSLQWYFGPHIRDVGNWLNIKYLFESICVSRLNRNFFKYLYWALTHSATWKIRKV